MSDDDFMVGFPAESSSESFVVGGVARGAPRGARAPAIPDVGGDGGGDSESSDFIMGGREEAVPVEPGPRRRQRRRRQAQTSGSFWAVATAGDAGVAAGIGNQDAFALVKLTWSLKHPDYDRRNKFDVGTLEYMVDKSLLFEAPLALPEFDTTAASVLRVVELCKENAVNITADGTNKVLYDFLEAERVFIQCLLVCSQTDVARVNRASAGVEAPIVFRPSVRINSRGRFPPTTGETPSKKDLELWRKAVRNKYQEICIEDPNPPPLIVDPLLHLPSGSRFEQFASEEPTRGRDLLGRRQADPVRLIEAINVAQHLRQPDLFRTVLEGCMDYLGLEESNHAIAHDFDLDPSRSTMDKALARADVVAMNIQRRQFHAWREADAIRSVNIYSDASPVVGAELQGMVIDINLNDGTTERMILPGSTLAYGFTGSLSKSVALLHALWLVAGPTAEDVRWLNTKVRSMTTDFGVEMHLLEAPDLVDAYMAHLNGNGPLRRLAPLVKHNTRMWARALRIAGWSHTIGGIMKTAAEAFPQWPLYLKHERALCKFFKNITYRKHIVRTLGPANPHLRLDLKGFTAGFAKWRYETETEVLRQLLKHRDLCENKLDPAMFSNAQDLVEIHSVFQACRDKQFWRWALVSHNDIFNRLERFRKWGMVCDHEECETIRRNSNYRKHVPCGRIHTLVQHTRFSFVFAVFDAFSRILFMTFMSRFRFSIHWRIPCTFDNDGVFNVGVSTHDLALNFQVH